jgi:adenine-specific DNA-methyltransferase
MAKGNTRLELTWIGKENRPKLEPRVLIEDAGKSYHAVRRVSENDLFDNRLIFGDNLLALKALEQEFTGKIKCIYIDPPYNTGSAFTHYDDGVEHSLWLSLMRDRLEILRRLLSEEGSIWINLDDNEGHYAKVLMDEIFGRPNFVANVLWQKRTSPDARIHLGAAHDHILVYARTRATVQFNRQPHNDTQKDGFKNPDNDPRGPWSSTDFTAQGWRPNQMYQITTPNGAVYDPPPSRCWANIESEFLRLRNDGRIWFGKSGGARPRVKNFLKEAEGVMSWTWWTNNEVGHNQEAKKESIELFGGDSPFETPKPERLLRRVIALATNPGDVVLDSFAGSGTTGAVAHKMGRRWIMVELGEHCHTHIIPRMKKVIDGEDQGGISKAVDWKGGGGFRYYRLGPSLIVEDEWGNPVINPEFNAAMLAEAMCKLEGFTFEPNAEVYWQHGRSSEADFIYVTTQMMTKEMLTKISDEVGPNRSLLICCSAFRCDVSQFENLTVRKIPKAVLQKCEWGKDDYSLEIKNLSAAPPAADIALSCKDEELACTPPRPQRKFGKGKDSGPTLFDMDAITSKGGR